MLSLIQRSFFALSLVLALTTSTAQAFEFGVPTDAGNVMVETNRTINDTFIGAGQDVDVRGIVDRDVIVAGETVGIHNTVTNNIIAAGKTVRITDYVGGGVIAAGQDIIIDTGARIDGGVIAAGDTIRIDGIVSGSVHLYGRSITLNGPIQGNVTVHAETVSIGSAIILGNVTGTIDKPLIKSQDARIEGKLDLKQDSTLKDSGRSMPMARGGGLFFGIFLTFLMGFICSAILVWLAPKYVERVRSLVQTHTNKALLTGIASVLLVIPLTILLLVMIVTLPIACVVFLVFMLAMMLGHLVSYLYIGDLVGMALTKKHWSTLGAIAAGALILAILGYVPLIGMLAVFLATSLGAGVILLDLWDRVVGHSTK